MKGSKTICELLLKTIILFSSMFTHAQTVCRDNDLDSSLIKRFTTQRGAWGFSLADSTIHDLPFQTTKWKKIHSVRHKKNDVDLTDFFFLNDSILVVKHNNISDTARVYFWKWSDAIAPEYAEYELELFLELKGNCKMTLSVRHYDGCLLVLGMRKMKRRKYEKKCCEHYMFRREM